MSFKLSKEFQLKFGGLKFNQLTIDVWTTLWVFDSPFTLDSDKITEADIDLFLAAVNASNLDDFEALAKSSINYCKNLNITYDLGKSICYALINLAFAPLRLFPKTIKKTEGGIPLYDEDWISSIVSKVHAQTGMSPERIMKTMTMNAACMWFVDWTRMQGQKNIGRKSNEEIVYQMDLRANALIVDRLIEKGVIKEEDREYYEIAMRSPSKRPAGFKIREP